MLSVIGIVSYNCDGLFPEALIPFPHDCPRNTADNYEGADADTDIEQRIILSGFRG